MMSKYILPLLFSDWFIHSNNLSQINMSVTIVSDSNEVLNKEGKCHPVPTTVYILFFSINEQTNRKNNTWHNLRWLIH